MLWLIRLGEPLGSSIWKGILPLNQNDEAFLLKGIYCLDQTLIRFWPDSEKKENSLKKKRGDPEISFFLSPIGKWKTRPEAAGEVSSLIPLQEPVSKVFNLKLGTGV